MVTKGPMLIQGDCLSLIKPFTIEEMDNALFSIGSDKAPGLDGYNSLFFRKIWSMIRYELFEAYNESFRDCKMNKTLNCTAITLIPKVANPSNVVQYKPISCCNVLYKVICKMLSVRLQRVIPNVVSLAQTGFIPERKILDNVLLATELIKWIWELIS